MIQGGIAPVGPSLHFTGSWRRWDAYHMIRPDMKEGELMDSLKKENTATNKQINHIWYKIALIITSSNMSKTFFLPQFAENMTL